jgi:hypothetical protein
MNSEQWIDRYKRASEQRMYLIESSKNGSEFQFFVMGNTDKQYKITIGKKISCTCPDCFHSHKFCKHLMLLTIRMLGLPEERVKTDLFTVSDRCIDACMNYFQRKLQAETIVPEESGNRKPLDDELGCPICCEELTNSEEILWCQTCGKNVHKDCFKKWKKPTCVFCRSEMTPNKKRKIEWKPDHLIG